MLRSWIAIAVCGCSAKPEPPPPAAVKHVDAGIDGITVIPGFDPSSGMHLDDDGPNHPVARKPQTHPGHPIDITLRSTPPGAMAAVDGIQIGTTPTYWAGEANGREHEFTFVLEGHATARYRFVPITSGVIHGRLEPVAGDTSAVVAPPEVVPPIQPPPPPTTLVTPDAAPHAQLDATFVPIDAAINAPPLAIDAGGDQLFGPRQ